MLVGTFILLQFLLLKKIKNKNMYIYKISKIYKLTFFFINFLGRVEQTN